MLKMRYDIFGSEVLGEAELEGKYEFPITEGVRLFGVPDKVIPFDRMKEVKRGDWVHFYVHDKRFHRFLSRREGYWRALSSVGGFIGIDNSIYRDLPLAEQIHSCYLNRATDYYLHTRGRPVVANVSWGDSRSYEFCFDGVARHSTIAVSSYGCCRSRNDRAYFEDGFIVMLERLTPCSVVFHGATWPELEQIVSYHGVPLLRIPTHRSAVARNEVWHG